MLSLTDIGNGSQMDYQSVDRRWLCDEILIYLTFNYFKTFNLQILLSSFSNLSFSICSFHHFTFRNVAYFIFDDALLQAPLQIGLSFFTASA